MPKGDGRRWEVIEITSGCRAIPYRKKRRKATVAIPPGAIVERATVAMVKAHMPRRLHPDHPRWVCRDRSDPGRLEPCAPGHVEADDGAWHPFCGYAVLSTGDVAVLYGLDRFEAIGEGRP